MALTGTLLADFSSFTAECAKAEQSLQGFEQGAGKVEVALDGVAAANDRVTASTQKGADVIDIFGKRRNSIAKQVAEMPALLAAESAAWKTVTVSAYDADKALSAFHVGAQQLPSTLSLTREAFNGLADGIGLTVDQLGLFGSAGLVAATAIESWKLGRWIAEVTDADQTIADFTAKMLGWGDRVAAMAGVVDLSLSKESQKAADWADAFAKAIERGYGRTTGIMLQGFADLNNSVADAYTADIDRMIAKTHEEEQAQQDFIKTASDLYDLRIQMERHVTDATLKETNDRIAADFKEAQAQKAILDEFNKSLEVIPEVGHAADDLTKEFGKTAEGTDRASGSMAAFSGSIRFAATDMATLNQELKEFYDAASRGAGVGIPDPGTGSGAMPRGTQLPVRDSGGPVSAGSSYLIGVNRKPEIFTPGTSGFITPLGAGGSTVIQNTFHIVDTEANIVSRVSAAITRSLLQSTKMGAA